MNFHVNEQHQALPCRARDHCPFEHFETLEEARNHAESELERTTSTPRLQKSSKNFVENISERVSLLGTDPSSDELVSIGADVDNEIKRRLSFDTDSVDQEQLTAKHLDEIETVNKKVMSELATCTESTNRNPTGPRAVDVDKTVTTLPDGAKNYVSTDPLRAETARGKVIGGQHKHGYLPVKVKFVDEPNMIEQKLSGAPDGEFYSTGGFDEEELQNPRTSFRIEKRDDSAEKVQQYWVGDKPRGKSKMLRKVGDTSELYVNGKKMVVDKPVYEVHVEDHELQTHLSVPNAKTDEGQSVIIHEYGHAIQHGYHVRMAAKHDESEGADHEAADEAMWHELKEQKTFSHDYKMVTHKGFPEDYMGTGSKEFFPKATEGFWKPRSPGNSFLYGRDRHPNADRVRQWTSAFWLHLDQSGKRL